MPAESSSAAVAAHAGSVLVPYGEAPLAPVKPAAYALQGSTANFDVAYDTTLGSNGPNLAQAVLANCESDLSKLEGFFGIANPGRYSIFIDPGSFGAYHASCPAREIHCAAFTGMSGDLENFLNCAEVDEVFMAAQNAGWNCSASAGEGLSRVLATELHPASLGQFATASIWLNSSRPDWVSQTEGTDRDHVSIGCATLFINYLRHQLRFTLPQIVQAGGTTLQQTYERLTGSTNAFGPFAALLAAYFPPGIPVNLVGDNPFPILKVPEVMYMPEAAAARVVILAGLVPKFTGVFSANTFVNSQSPTAGHLVPGGTAVAMHLVKGEAP